MKVVPIKEAGTQLDALMRLAEAGERVVLTRDGKPVADLVAHVPDPPRTGIDFEAGHAWLKAQGIDRFFSYIADDFDDPLDEDFLIRPE